MIRKIKNIIHLLKAVAANIFYGFPSRKIYVIGVTGTDGKTTITSLIYHILKESGKNAAMITSVGAYIGNKQYDIGFHVTTPSSWGLQKYIKKAVDLKNEYLVLETTSHALDQNRVYGINYQIGVLTNITHEHLDYHGTYENYLNIKFKLLEKANTAIFNRDDESYQYVSSNFKFQISNVDRVKKIISYGLSSNSDVNPKNFKFKTKLIGEFNKYNCLAAIAVCRNLGLTDQQIRSAILTFKVPPGREEIIYDKKFTVMIDFAHTPNAFLKILPEVRRIAKNRLIHVFGSAGRRDASKRPFMGDASAKYSDIIILTAEDPRDEDVNKIIDEIAQGIKISNFSFDLEGLRTEGHFPISNKISTSNYQIRTNKKYVFRIPDRKEAIEFAISIAKEGDLVICTGKSHEKSINYGKGEMPWDEFGICYEAIKKREKKFLTAN